MSLTIVIAPDSFKGSLTAAAAASALADGWQSIRPGDDIVVLPQADGGEGTLDAIESSIPAAVRHRITGVTGPDLRPVAATWLELPDGLAVVELAESSGLPLMSAPDPLGATTRGLGEVIRAALDAGAQSLVIALGGSASTDGGAGALQALGMRMLDADGADIGLGGGCLAELHSVDGSRLVPPPAGGVVLLTDVTAPLLGAGGAAAAFAPQKGATPGQVTELERSLARLAEVLGGDPATPGSGAAGGTAFGLIGGWGATVQPGAAWLARLTGLTAAVPAADVVITGEGRFDRTSLGGKVVGNIVELAGDSRVGVIAGSVAIEHDAWTLGLVELAGSEDSAMADPGRWLTEAGRVAAHHFGSAHP